MKCVIVASRAMVPNPWAADQSLLHSLLNFVHLKSFPNLCTDFPKLLKSREELIEYLTIIIFTASAQHASINFGQVRDQGEVPVRAFEAQNKVQK